eukprot:8738659-Pyramimonas_sp.AAC.1
MAPSVPCGERGHAHPESSASPGVDDQKGLRLQFNSRQSSTVDCQHYYTIQRTAFRIFHRIFNVYSLSTDCHWLAVSRVRGLELCAARHTLSAPHVER